MARKKVNGLAAELQMSCNQESDLSSHDRPEVLAMPHGVNQDLRGRHQPWMLVMDDVVAQRSLDGNFSS
jgi:hypothetical protein